MITEYNGYFFKQVYQFLSAHAVQTCPFPGAEEKERGTSSGGKVVGDIEERKRDWLENLIEGEVGENLVLFVEL